MDDRHVQGRARWVGVAGVSHARLRSDANWIRRYLASAPYLFLVNNFHTDVAVAFKIPPATLFEVGVPYDI
jgi:hypothetical protein